MANEEWKKAKALQDRIDEERLAEEQAAQARGKSIDNILKAQEESKEEGNQVMMQEKSPSQPLLFRQADPLDGDYFPKLERIVHLDLKGAPPLVSYLEKLFPLMKTMGATGILMEYEDMFPYTGNLSLLAAGNAYSQSDLQHIQAAARDNGLEIIPLVQTFGHMEFVLKYKRFLPLREYEYTPQVITPVREESYELIFNMLEQILKAHPDSRRIHLGCDEVYGLGGGQSSAYITSQSMSPGQLYLQHVTKITRHLKETFPKFQSLIWDDWLRKIDEKHIADSGLPDLVEPVVWYYRHNIMDRVPPKQWDAYGKLFHGVWVGSAFKGATGSAQIITNASVHVDNNLQFVDIMRRYGIQTKKITFRGIMVTGWQRYDHYGTLCELLPVGLPSLALSLQALRSGSFGSKEVDNASRVLRCSNSLDLEFPPLKQDGAVVSQDCSFPGSNVFYGIQQLWGIRQVYLEDRSLKDQITGWVTDYHVRLGISNPGRMKLLMQKLEKVLKRLQELIRPMRDSLLQIYDKWTVDEWVTNSLQDEMIHINDIYEKARKLLEPKEWPAQPFNSGTVAPSGGQHQAAPLQTGAAQSGQAGKPAGSGGQYGNQKPMGTQDLNANKDISVQHQAVQGPQSMNGGGQRNPFGPVSQLVNAAQNYGRLPPQGVGLGQQQNPASVNAQGSQGGMLSHTLLKKPDQGIQGRPSGPSKMQNYYQNPQKPYTQGRQAQQAMNFQVVPEQSLRGQPELRQYVRGLPQGQLPPQQNQLLGVQQNQQGLGRNQYNQPQNQQSMLQNAQSQALKQNQGLVQKFQGQKDQNLMGFGQNQQGLHLNQQRPLTVKGPENVAPVPLNQMLSAKDQRREEEGNDKKRVSDANKAVDKEDNDNEDLKASNRNDKGQEDTKYLDPFIGKKGKDGNGINEDIDDPDKEADKMGEKRIDYEDEEDEAV